MDAKEKILEAIEEMIEQRKHSIERFEKFGDLSSSKQLMIHIENRAVLENLLNLKNLVIYSLGI